MKYLARPSVAALISCAMVIVALLISDFLIGTAILVPLLESFIEERRASGDSVGVFEAVTVFVSVTVYMLIITVLVGAAALSGWIVSRLTAMNRLSLSGLIELFRVEEPD